MEHEIENVLRAAPRPTPPAGLKERLIAQVRLPELPPAAQDTCGVAAFSRLAPSLVAGAGTSRRFPGLRRRPHRAADGNSRSEAGYRRPLPRRRSQVRRYFSANRATTEWHLLGGRCRDSHAGRGRPAQSPGRPACRLRWRNWNRCAPRTPSCGPSSPRLRRASSRRRKPKRWPRPRNGPSRIACVNNMKQLALASRIWAIDHGDVSPPDILSMTNKVYSRQSCWSALGIEQTRGGKGLGILHPGRIAPTDNLAPSAPNVGTEPDRVAFRCPIHGTVARCDGSVHRGVAKDASGATGATRTASSICDSEPRHQRCTVPQPATPPPGAPNP